MAVKFGLGEAGSRTCVGWQFPPNRSSSAGVDAKQDFFLLLFFTPFMGTTRGGPSIERGCTHVHPKILANELEISR